jgi:ABC-type glycerol-3-phosphate transport system substrate-binding protein
VNAVSSAPPLGGAAKPATPATPTTPATPATPTTPAAPTQPAQTLSQMNTANSGPAVSPVSGLSRPASTPGLFAGGQQPSRPPVVQQTQQPLPTQPIQGYQPQQQAVGGQATGQKNASPVLKAASPKTSPFAFLTGSPLKLAAIVGVLLLVVGGGIFAFSTFMRGGSQSVSIEAPRTGTTGTNQGGTTGANQGRTTPPAPPAQQKTITYWGLWEQTDQFKAVIQEFEEQNPGIKVNYVQQNHVDYRERLQTAIASGKGPDLFRFHASWTPMLSQELDPMPDSVFSPREFQQAFFPIATRQLLLNGKIMGVPLMYDGLGIYINTEIFRQAALAEPTTWAELKNAAIQLTVRNASGEVERGGLAIGNASNVEHFSDILGLLILQNGGDPNNPSTREVVDALRFYTGFYRTDRVWSDKLPTSTVAFARGEVAMMFAPSWRVHEIMAMNPDFTDFKVIATPTLGDQRLAWGTFWAEGVNSKSANKAESWKLLKYLSSSEVMQSRYSKQSETRLFGELYSRQDLASELILSQDSVVQNMVAPYLEDAPYARSWYMNSYTHDNGINDQIIQYYRDAVNAVIGGTQPEKAMQPVIQGVPQVLRQYGAAQNQ